MRRREPGRRPRRTRLVLLAVALALATGACYFGSEFGSGYEGPRFDHSLHSEGVECTSCHAGATTEAKAGMPSRSQCRLCHKSLDEDKPPERQSTAFFEGDVLKSAHVTALSDEVVFSHEVHVTKYAVACTECHGDIAASKAVPASARVTMDRCISCHKKANRQDECAVCHSEVRADVAPPTHLQNWPKRHGKVMHMEGDADAARCTLCHVQQRDCVACHQAEPPADHTNYWRQRGHGISVRIDRGRCATCHQTDSCDRCHQENAPRNHIASWGSPLDKHCLSCHTPLSQESCVACHKSTPSHLLAAPMPPDHTPGMNCRQCHGLSAPLPHPDKGDSCESCHK